MPKPFNVVSQGERETLDLEADEARHGVQVQNGDRFSLKYAYLSPKMKKILCGSLLAFSFFIGVGVLSSKDGGNGNAKRTWPPPKVGQDDYLQQGVLSMNRDPASLSLKLEAGRSYKQLSNVKTTTKLELGRSNKFAQTVRMETENQLNVSPWDNYEGTDEIGLSIEVVFSRLSVTTQDSGGDFTYYNSLAENGDTDFDAVLEDMVRTTATVDINYDYTIIDEQDSENQLEEMEQEYSLGTTTGLSAMDQVSQITNLKTWLPPRSDVLYSPGDSWELSFQTDISFIGTGTLLGYLTYNGVECAVVKCDFTVDPEADNFLGDDDLFDAIQIIDGEISSFFYWDVAGKLPLYINTVISMDREMNDDDGDDDGEDERVDMEEVIESYFLPL